VHLKCSGSIVTLPYNIYIAGTQRQSDSDSLNKAAFV
jgi:hypothetical protein